MFYCSLSNKLFAQWWPVIYFTCFCGHKYILLNYTREFYGPEMKITLFTKVFLWQGIYLTEVVLAENIYNFILRMFMMLN